MVSRFLVVLLARPRTCGAFVVVLLLFFTLHSLLNVWRGDLGDFDDFYKAAQSLRAHQDIYVATAGRYIYPAFLAFVLEPLSWLPENAAASVWVILNFFFFGISLFVISREAADRWQVAPGQPQSAAAWVIASLVALLAADKIHGVFTLGQTDALVLLAFAATISWTDRRPALAGLAVGAVGCIKYLSLIFIPYFLVTRRYRAAGASLASFLICLCFPAFQIGWVANSNLSASAFKGLGAMAHPIVTAPAAKIHPITWERSISVTSAAFRLARARGFSDAYALVWLALAAAIVLSAAFWCCRRYGVNLFAPEPSESLSPSSRAVTLDWAALTILALTFSPQTTSRHMVLMVVVYAVAVAMLFQADRRSVKLVSVSLLIMVAGLSLPLRGLGLTHALRNWRTVSGPAWCALLLLFAVLSQGSRLLQATNCSRNPRSNN